MSPRVAVVVTTYNRADLLPATLQSLAAQTMPDFEVVVVDDGSREDPSPLVLMFGPRFRCYRQTNAGQPVARNVGIAATSAPLLAFVDDDDLWLPDKLERQLAALAAHPDCGWCHIDGTAFGHATGRDVWCWRDRHELLQGWVDQRLLMGNGIASPSVLVRRSLLVDCGGFDPHPARRLGEDWLMWLKLASRSPLAWVDAAGFRLRIHDGGMTTVTSAAAMQRLADGHLAVLHAAAEFAPECYRACLPAAMIANRWLLARQARHGGHHWVMCGLLGGMAAWTARRAVAALTSVRAVAAPRR